VLTDSDVDRIESWANSVARDPVSRRDVLTLCATVRELPAQGQEDHTARVIALAAIDGWNRLVAERDAALARVNKLEAQLARANLRVRAAR